MNEFLKFCDTGTNVQGQAEYAANPVRTTGALHSTQASSRLTNKVLKQTSFMANLLGRLISERSNRSALDNNDSFNIMNGLTDAINNSAKPSFMAQSLLNLAPKRPITTDPVWNASEHQVFQLEGMSVYLLSGTTGSPVNRRMFVCYCVDGITWKNSVDFVFGDVDSISSNAFTDGKKIYFLWYNNTTSRFMFRVMSFTSGSNFTVVPSMSNALSVDWPQYSGALILKHFPESGKTIACLQKTTGNSDFVELSYDAVSNTPVLSITKTTEAFGSDIYDFDYDGETFVAHNEIDVGYKLNDLQPWIVSPVFSAAATGIVLQNKNVLLSLFGNSNIYISEDQGSTFQGLSKVSIPYDNVSLMVHIYRHNGILFCALARPFATFISMLSFAVSIDGGLTWKAQPIWGLTTSGVSSHIVLDKIAAFGNGIGISCNGYLSSGVSERQYIASSTVMVPYDLKNVDNLWS